MPPASVLGGSGGLLVVAAGQVARRPRRRSSAVGRRDRTLRYSSSATRRGVGQGRAAARAASRGRIQPAPDRLAVGEEEGLVDRRVASAPSWGWPATPPNWRTNGRRWRPAGRRPLLDHRLAERPPLGVGGEDRLHPRVGPVEPPTRPRPRVAASEADRLHHAPGQLLGRESAAGPPRRTCRGSASSGLESGRRLARSAGTPASGPARGGTPSCRTSSPRTRGASRSSSSGLRRRVLAVVQVDAGGRGPGPSAGPRAGWRCSARRRRRLGRGQRSAPAGPGG